MSWFARIEEACAAFIEQTFARSFPTDVEPAQIARKLVATMEARTVHESNRASAPRIYTVRVSADDYERLAPHKQYLESEWAALLTDMASLVSIALGGPVAVHLTEDGNVVGGAVEIDAAHDRRLPEWTGERVPGAFVLRMVKGVPPEGRFEVGSGVTIGRNSANDIVLADPRVSRNHARIDVTPRGAKLVDLESTNGTRLDGKRVDGSAALRPGQTITVGNTELRFEERDR